jgi:hypothetical protein
LIVNSVTDILKKNIEPAIQKIVKRRKLSKDTSKKTLLDIECNRLKKELLDKTKLPRGTLAQTVNNVKRKHGIDDFTQENLQSILNPRGKGIKNIELWNKVVNEQFDGVWNQGVEKASKGKQPSSGSSPAPSPSLAGPSYASFSPMEDPVAGPVEDPASLAGPSSTSFSPMEDLMEGPSEDPMVIDKGDSGHPDKGNEPAKGNDGEPDDDDDGEDEDEDEEKKDKESKRVCTTTLKSILRSDLGKENYDQFLKLVKDSQEKLTNIMEEVSVLAEKTIHVVSNLVFLFMQIKY